MIEGQLIVRHQGCIMQIALHCPQSLKTENRKQKEENKQEKIENKKRKEENKQEKTKNKIRKAENKEEKMENRI